MIISIKKYTLVLVACLLVMYQFFIPLYSQSVHAVDQNDEKIVKFERLDSFGRDCSLATGNQTYSSLSDLRSQLDKKTLVGYYSNPSSAGLERCLDSIVVVMNSVTSRAGGKIKNLSDGQYDIAIRRLAGYLLKGGTKVAEEHANGNTNYPTAVDLFPAGASITISTAQWANWVKTYLTDYATKNAGRELASIDLNTRTKLVARRLLPLMNYCYDWTQSNPGGDKTLIKAEHDNKGIYGIRPQFTVERFNLVYPASIRTEVAIVGAEDNFERESVGLYIFKINNNGAPSHTTGEWFTFGRSMKHISNVIRDSGMLGCDDIKHMVLQSSAYNQSFINMFEVTSGGKIKIIGEETPPPPTEPTEPPSSESEDQDSCDVQMYNPLSWVLCPVIKILETGVNQFYNAANRALNFTIESGEDQLKLAWVSLRNIANILFIISFLFIIISQSIVGKL